MLSAMAIIRAGKVSEIIPSSGDWLILDVGFANKQSSCGLLVNDTAPVELRFNEAMERVCTFISKNPNPVNLVVEAPLSVAFDKAGNPTGRKIEKQGVKTRYWYVGLGCTVMVAALYLVKAISEIQASTEVRLFEGFVSFKAKGVRSNHSRDVELLREVVMDQTKFPGAVVPPDALRMSESDVLQSAFLVAGIDIGVPPIIMRNG